MLANNDDKRTKPGFDARLQYNDVLKSILQFSKLCSINSDYKGWYKGLRSLFNMVTAYIEPKDRKNIKDQIDIVKKKLKGYEQYGNKWISQQQQTQAEEALLELEENIHISAKDIFLPVGGDETDDVDWDEVRTRGRS